MSACSKKSEKFVSASRKFYQKITDIYATALDYDIDSKTTKDFFATVQNKLHWAIHGHTAAEVIVERADVKKRAHGLDILEKCANRQNNQIRCFNCQELSVHRGAAKFGAYRNRLPELPFLSWLFDHSLKINVWAMNLVSLHAILRNGPEYPLFYRIWRKPQVKGDGLTKLDLAQEMLYNYANQSVVAYGWQWTVGTWPRIFSIS